MLMQLFNPNVGVYGVIHKSLTGMKPADPFAVPESFFYMEYIPERTSHESGELAVLRPCWIFRVDIPEVNRLGTAILDYCVDAVTGRVL